MEPLSLVVNEGSGSRSLSHLTLNLIPKVRRVTLNGREYLVAPATLIVPGVLSGSNGPLYYPPEEIANNYDSWNGIPIVLNHPQDKQGNYISGRQPPVIEKYGMGYIFDTHVDAITGKLKCDLWFDVQDTQRVDKRVYNALLQGSPIRLSTGLYTKNEKAPTNAVFNSPKGPKPYTHIARNYRPDHLAILPDQQAACGIEDGCGVLVNQFADWLSSNCGGEGSGIPGPCPSGREHKEKKENNRSEQLANSWVNDPSSLNQDERRELSNLARQSETSKKSLIRIVRDDPEWEEGEVVTFGSPTATTSKVNEILQGKPAGIIAWKSSDGALLLFDNPRHGIDVDYNKVKGKHFYAGGESETIVGGKYRVKEVRKVTEPGTSESSGHKVKMYVLTENCGGEGGKSVKSTNNQGEDKVESNHPDSQLYHPDKLTLLSRFLHWLKGNNTPDASEISVTNTDIETTDIKDEECTCEVVNGACVNCGGEGGKPGPCKGSGKGDHSTWKVGQRLTYTGKIGSMPAELRGFMTVDGEKQARVIVRPEGEPPFETTVKLSELSEHASTTTGKPSHTEKKADKSTSEPSSSSASKHTDGTTDDAVDYVKSVARSSKIGGTVGIDVIKSELKKHERPNDESYWDFAKRHLDDKDIVRTWKEAKSTRNAASDSLDITPEKACKILRDGEVHGKPLTEAQKGMFGAKCGERKTNNSGSVTVHTGEPDCEVCLMRDATINWLTANCDCWKGPNARKALDTMSDDELNKLKANAEVAQARELALNKATSTLVSPDGKKLVWNTKDLKWEEEKVKDNNNQHTQPGVNQQSQATLNDLLNAADPDTKAAWGMLQQFQANRKSELIGLITANRQGQDKVARQQALATRSLPQLEEMWNDIQAAIPPNQQGTNNQGIYQIPGQAPVPLSLTTPYYGLAGGAPTTNQLNQQTMNDLMPSHEVDWEDIAGLKKGKS